MILSLIKSIECSFKYDKFNAFFNLQACRVVMFKLLWWWNISLIPCRVSHFF